ncbi:MAG: hypothetical protein P1U85_11480 [Verrucomicrobiales bacterium]|nr:hypothetical protein [Verrucomicrobiales bacterium]
MSEEKKTITFVTICLVLIGAGVFFLKDRKPPSVEIEDRMAAIQVAIEEWYAEKGSLPETLEELGLPEEETQDIIKKTFIYSVSDDGTTVTIGTLGADSKPGGKMFRADKELVFTLGEEKEKSGDPES